MVDTAFNSIYENLQHHIDLKTRGICTSFTPNKIISVYEITSKEYSFKDWLSETK